MLNMVSLPYSPFSWMAVMSFVPGMPIIFQFFVSRVVLTQISERMCLSFRPLSSGKTGRKFVGVRIALNLFSVWGSCTSMMSHLPDSIMLMISSCAVWDLLRLIWKICKGMGGLVEWWWWWWWWWFCVCCSGIWGVGRRGGHWPEGGSVC